MMVVEDVRGDPRFAHNPLVTGAPFIGFYAGATLTTKDGHNLGTLCVIDTKPRPRPQAAILEQLKLLARIAVDEFELAKAHAATREQQRLLEMAEAMAKVGHWRLEVQSQRLTWSDAVYAIHGVTRDGFDPSLQEALSFYHPDDRARVRAHLEACITAGQAFAFQLRLVQPDGVLRHVACRGVCERDTTGAPYAVFGLFQDVTETVEGIETLKRRKAQYRLVAENAADVIARYDFTGQGRFISPAIEKLLGYSVAETATLNVPVSLHPDDLAPVMAVFQEMAAGRQTQATLQHRSKHKNGTYVWLESTLQLVRAPSGQPQEIVAVSRDISERKRLEFDLIAARDEAREQAQRARLAEEIAGLGHWRYDFQTKSLAVSRQMFAIYGLAEVERPNHAIFFNCVHPDERDWTLARIAERLRTGEADHNVLTRIVRPDGQERCLTGTSVTVCGADGAPAFMMGTVRDVTDEHRAQTALAQSEARYRLLADNASDMIATFTPSGELCFISPACLNVLGYTPAEMVGFSLLDRVHPADREAIIDYYSALFRRGPEASAEPFEFRMRHRDGRWIWLEGQPTLSYGPDGGVVSIQDVAREVTGRKAMEAALIQARGEAEAAAAVKAEFLSNMSHELRTPLTAVLGFSQLIGEQTELSPATRKMVERVAHAGQALLSTVNDILDFSKLEAGQVEIRKVACDPTPILDDALGLFAWQAQEKGLALTRVGGETLPSGLLLAPDRLRQVLLNLIGNAIKFTERGGVTLELGWDGLTHCLKVRVKDTGAGIAPERQAALFKRFSQVDGAVAPRQPGTGLGLAICKGLVEAMGGEIGVESQVGQGSCFWFTLPAPPAELLASEAEDQDARGVRPGLKVLVVDDNPTNRDLVQAVLSALGCETVEAASGEAGIHHCQSTRFDLVLMDLRMPGMDGLTAARAIRAGSLNQHAPILAFSADVTAVPDPVFNGAVTKPLHLATLVSEIERVFGDAA